MGDIQRPLHTGMTTEFRVKKKNYTKTNVKIQLLILKKYIEF